MNQESKHLPKWAQWLSGIALMSAVLTASGLSLAMNLTAGLSIGVMVAIAFGLSDVTKVLLPIVCQAIGWTRHLKTTYIVASVVSVVCAVCFLADQFGQDIAGKENAAAISVNLDLRIDDLRMSAKKMRADAFAEGQRGGCGDNCKALHPKADDLDKQLSETLARREGIGSEKVDGKASVLAGIIGTDESDTSRGIAIMLIIATLLISELVTHASGSAAAMIGTAMAPQKVANVSAPLTVREKSAKAVAKLKADVAKPTKTVANRDYYIARLEREFPEYAKRVANGELSVYAACVAAGLRKAPNKKRNLAKIEAYKETESNHI